MCLFPHCAPRPPHQQSHATTHALTLTQSLCSHRCTSEVVPVCGGITCVSIQWCPHKEAARLGAYETLFVNSKGHIFGGGPALPSKKVELDSGL